MAENRSGEPQANRLYAFTIARPWALVTILFLIVCFFKFIDNFALRLDELVGEAILTKGLGLLLVFLYLRLAGKRLQDLGFHTRYLGKTLLLSGLGFVLVYIVAVAIQMVAFRLSGEPAQLAISAVDPKTGMTGGVWFAIWMFLANLINSGMEEGLFRGVFIKSLLGKSSRWGALLASAGIFAIWHLGWPLRHYLDGASTLSEAAFEALTLLLATFIAGISYGYLYLKTDNLWGVFLAHTINNTLLNMLFFRTDSGLQAASSSMLFMLVVLLGYLALLPVIKAFTARTGTPEVQAWEPPI